MAKERMKRQEVSVSSVKHLMAFALDIIDELEFRN